MWIIFILLALGWRPGEGLAAPSRLLAPPKRCVLSRTYNMLGADCRELNLINVPTALNSDIQVLDLTFNRIRELQNASFVNYASLRFLYLEDNSISFIEMGAFEPLSDLEVLDLSYNSLHTMPEALHSLPVLRKLNLGRNPFATVNFLIPLPSVEHLDLSNSKLRELPSLEMFPRLLGLNVSYNRIRKLNVHQLAPMCRLRDLDLRENRNLFMRDGFCDCVVLVRWAAMRQIKTLPGPNEICRSALRAIAAPVDNATCFTNETDLMFEESRMVIRSCEAEVLEYGSGPIRIRGSVLWTIGALAACVVLIMCVSSVYLVRRRQRHLPDRSEVRLTAKKERS